MRNSRTWVEGGKKAMTEIERGTGQRGREKESKRASLRKLHRERERAYRKRQSMTGKGTKEIDTIMRNNF